MLDEIRRWIDDRGLTVRGRWRIDVDWYPKPTRIMLEVRADRWSIIVSHRQKKSFLVIDEAGVEAFEGLDELGIAQKLPPLPELAPFLARMTKRWLLPLTRKSVKVTSTVRGAEKAVRVWLAPEA